MRKEEIKGRIATLALGHTGDILMTKGYTYLIALPIMSYFGAVWGTTLNLVCSFLLCLFLMKMYDWSKRDWLGLELVKEVREDGRKGNLFSRIMSWALRKGDWAVFLVLAVFKDAFYATVWMRKGANQYNGMGSRDWKIFMSTLIISTLIESTWLLVGLEIVKRLWNSMVG